MAGLIAFYLPQFHPIPENDRWWGEGFTEWTNVRRATPRFPGHDQPKVPGELGYYDLRSPETRAAQAALAKAHGVDAFCYYHYWFGGRRLLEQPFDAVLASGEPDLPFLLCWANEPWTRAWDGRTGETLMDQPYGGEREHLRALAPAFADPRYVRVDGKPFFLVYRAAKLPDARRTTDLWRDEAARLGLGDLYLARVDSQAEETRVHPGEQGFDTAVEFQPAWGRLLALPDRGDGDTRVFDYADVVAAMKHDQVPYARLPCVTPAWDNAARRERGAIVLRGSTPEAYEEWLRAAVRRAEVAGQPYVFVNAWNEWAEGAYLEPDARWGRAYLEATARVMRS